MSIFDDIFSSKDQETGSSTEKTTATRIKDENSREVLDILERLFTEGESITTKGTPFSRGRLDSLIKAITTGIGRFSKDKAIEDVRGSVDSLLTRLLNRDLPDIRSSNTIAGGFNSSTTQILKDNVFASAAREGAELQQKTILDYANITGKGLDIINQLLGQVQESNVIVEDTEEAERVVEEEKVIKTRIEEESQVDIFRDFIKTRKTRDSAFDITQSIFKLAGFGAEGGEGGEGE